MSKLVDAKPFQPRTSSPSETATHQILPNVSLAPAQPETSDYVMNNGEMLMHVHGASAYEGSVSFSGHTETLPVDLLQVQCRPMQQFQPTTYYQPRLAASTYRAQTCDYLAATCGVNRRGVQANHPAGGCVANFPFGMPAEPAHTFSFQRLYRQQWPVSRLQQQQQMFGNPQRYFTAYDETINQRRRHNKHWRKK